MPTSNSLSPPFAFFFLSQMRIKEFLSLSFLSVCTKGLLCPSHLTFPTSKSPSLPPLTLTLLLFPISFFPSSAMKTFSVSLLHPCVYQHCACLRLTNVFLVSRLSLSSSHCPLFLMSLSLSHSCLSFVDKCSPLFFFIINGIMTKLSFSLLFFTLYILLLFVQSLAFLSSL